MLPRFRTTFVTATLLVLPLTAAVAQRPIEIGMDAGFQANFNGTTIWGVSIPVQAVRLGIQATDQVTVEPRLSFNHLDLGDFGGSATTLDGSLNILFYFQTGDRPRPYFTAGGTLVWADAGGSSDSEFGAGGGFGVSIPIVSQLAARLEGRFDRFFDSEVNRVAGLFGLSFFTR